MSTNISVSANPRKTDTKENKMKPQYDQDKTA